MTNDRLSPLFFNILLYKTSFDKPQVIKLTSCLPMVSGSLRVLRVLL